MAPRPQARRRCCCSAFASAGFVWSRIIDHAVVPEELREEFLSTTDLLLDERGYRYRDEAGNLYLVRRGILTIVAADGTVY